MTEKHENDREPIEPDMNSTASAEIEEHPIVSEESPEPARTEVLSAANLLKKTLPYEEPEADASASSESTATELMDPVDTETALIESPSTEETTQPAVQETSSEPSAEKTEAHESHYDDEYEEDEVREKRGTMSAGIFLLRLALSAWLIVSSVQILLPFAGGPSTLEFEKSFTGLDYSAVIANVLPIVQLIAGLFLLVGVATPVGAALSVVVTGFLLLTATNGYSGSWWPNQIDPTITDFALLTLIGLSIIFLGPGRISIDRNASWARRPLYSAWIFALLSLGGLAALWIFVSGISV